METSDPRVERLLDAAIGVFARYGFRKTSMDQAARAAQISRQGLYLRYATKEALFRAAVRHLLETGLRAAEAALGAKTPPLQPRLVRAFDEWLGRHIGILGADAGDVIEAGKSLMGEEICGYEERFLEKLIAAIERSGLARADGFEGLTAKQLAVSLRATARGLKHESPTREAFVSGFSVAATVFCAPLSRRSAAED